MAAELGALLWPLVLVPVLEEVVFRAGVLQQLTLALPSAPRPLLNALTSLLFVGAHLVHHPWTHAVQTFVPSYLLGMLWLARRSLLACCLLHIAMNAVYWVWRRA